MGAVKEENPTVRVGASVGEFGSDDVARARRAGIATLTLVGSDTLRDLVPHQVMEH